MDKKLLGFAAGALMVGASGASAHALLNPTSYAELLQPVDNATELLKAIDTAGGSASRVQTAQLYFGFGHHHHHNWHHHHHHHGWYHHHHHHGWYHHHHHGWMHHHHYGWHPRFRFRHHHD